MEAIGEPVDTTLEPRSVQKRKSILEAATALFLQKGYLGTSMDEVAARAAVSKQTVYKHFSDKQSLFEEIVVATVDEAGDLVHSTVGGLGASGNVRVDLVELARRELELVMQPRVLQLRRLVIGESARFPDLGRTFYERGPGRTIEALTAAFEQLAGRGVLRLSDPLLAAQHFNWLVLSIPLNRAMLLGRDEPLDASEIDHYAETGVGVFLAAYGL
jgi:AcrR family transcriptional regulator